VAVWRPKQVVLRVPEGELTGYRQGGGWVGGGGGCGGGRIRAVAWAPGERLITRQKKRGGHKKATNSPVINSKSPSDGEKNRLLAEIKKKGSASRIRISHKANRIMFTPAEARKTQESISTPYEKQNTYVRRNIPNA